MFMEASLICYTLGKVDHATRSSFKREFMGYEDSSNHGRYHYKRPGLLDKIPHLKPVNSVVVVRKRDSSKVKKILRKYKAKYKEFTIEISKLD